MSAKSLRAHINDPELGPLLLITLLAVFLNTFSLGDTMFWWDEGSTLVMGRFTLDWGYPKTVDSIYEYCQGWGTTPENIYVYHPWMQYYLTALAIFLFGKSVALLRLPFALIGAACVPLTWILGKRLGFSRRSLIFAALLLACNVPALLLNRQVRYYPLAPFFTLILLLLYLDIRAGKSKHGIAFGLCSLLFIHSMQPVCVAVIAAIILHALLFDPRAAVIGPLFKSLLFPLLGYGPLALYAWKTLLGSQEISGEHVLADQKTWKEIPVGIALYLVDLCKFHFPLWLLIPLFVRKRLKLPLQLPEKQVFVLFALCILSICLIMSIVYRSMIALTYSLSAVPLLCLCAGAVIDSVVGKDKAVAICLLVVTLFSNLLNWPIWPWKTPGIAAKATYTYADYPIRVQWLKESVPDYEAHFLLYNYLFNELGKSYEGPVEGIVKFLKSNSRPNETFFACNDYHTIHFMTGLPRINAVPFATPPDWIIPRGGSPWNRGACKWGNLDAEQIEQHVIDTIRNNPYEMIVLDYPDVLQENMPLVPYFHRWSTQGRTFKRKVTLFHLQRPPDHD